MKSAVVTREEWKKIPADYKGRLSSGGYMAFAGSLPKGRTTDTGTTLVPVTVVSNHNTIVTIDGRVHAIPDRWLQGAQLMGHSIQEAAQTWHDQELLAEKADAAQ